MPITELVRLLDADPELGRRIDDEHRPAERRLVPPSGSARGSIALAAQLIRESVSS